MIKMYQIEFTNLFAIVASARLASLELFSAYAVILFVDYWQLKKLTRIVLVVVGVVIIIIFFYYYYYEVFL